MRNHRGLIIAVFLALSTVLTVLSVSEIKSLWHKRSQISQELVILDRMDQGTVKALRKPGPVDPNARVIEDDVQIRIRALGVELDIINEATWTAVIKLAILWSLIFVSVLIYRYQTYTLTKKL